VAVNRPLNAAVWQSRSRSLQRKEKTIEYVNGLLSLYFSQNIYHHIYIAIGNSVTLVVENSHNKRFWLVNARSLGQLMYDIYIRQRIVNNIVYDLEISMRSM